MTVVTKELNEMPHHGVQSPVQSLSTCVEDLSHVR